MSPFVREDFVKIDRFDASLRSLHPLALRWRRNLVCQYAEVDVMTRASIVDVEVGVCDDPCLDG